MRIENSSYNKTISTENPEASSWNGFFSGFSSEVSSEEKKEIVLHFTKELSHIIQHHMQRMIEAYKKMKEERSE